MPIRSVSLLMLILISGCTLLLSPAEGKQVKAPPSTSRWAWTKEAWPASDAPYLAIRAEVDLLLSQGHKAEALLKSYRPTAAKYPRDPLAQFRLGYLARRATRKKEWLHKDLFMLEQVSESLARPPATGSYQYARIRWLLEMERPLMPLLPLGKRLLRRDPQDEEVKYVLIRLLHFSTLEDRRLALAYAQELLRSSPKNWAYHAAVGAGYKHLYDKTREPVHADNAIAAYEESIRLAPPQDDWKSWAPRLIRSIREKQNRATGAGRR